jgi:hypothetical protein
VTKLNNPPGLVMGRRSLSRAAKCRILAELDTVKAAAGMEVPLPISSKKKLSHP